mmetsp:Transcript_28561/g.50761  ORF Transcript_28561/g.50761 Transcript_28561/m.50761 type:complete len:163 (+) Transcript_28561:426-914(+)
MEERTRLPNIFPSALPRLPPPDLVVGQKEEINRTLELVLQKQTDLESRISTLDRQVEALKASKSRILQLERASPPTNLFSLSNSSLPLKLELADPLLTPLCKCKFFLLSIKLDGFLPFPCKLQVEVLAFTADSPPKRIERNLAGVPFIGGEQEATVQFSSQH